MVGYIAVKSRALYFVGPGSVEVAEGRCAEPGEGEITVAAEISAVSAGTELLLYRGQFPGDMLVDETLPGMRRSLSYPLKYGYALLGRVVAAGPGAGAALVGERVFLFHPHESLFVAKADEARSLPNDLAPEDAVFLPFMETAVGLVMDGRPLLGEHVVVFGQGVIGLMTTALLSRFPLASLCVVEPCERRREAALMMGAGRTLESVAGRKSSSLPTGPDEGADLVFELSGRPETLDSAIGAARFGGRVVIGSWYGTKQSPVSLGGPFHRKRIAIISSQVSTLAPALSGCWTKERRMQASLDLLRLVNPSRLVTHRYPLEEAPAAYAMMDRGAEDHIQTVFTY